MILPGKEQLLQLHVKLEGLSLKALLYIIGTDLCIKYGTKKTTGQSINLFS